MAHLNDRRVHFDIPMDDESESQAPSSNAGDTSSMMYFGFGAPPVHSQVNTADTVSALPYQLNFGLNLNPHRRTNRPLTSGLTLTSMFHSHLGQQLHRLTLRRCRQGRRPGLTLGLNLGNCTPPILQPAFNFGFDAGIEASPTPPPVARPILDFGWNTPVATNDPVTPVTTPFNFGMDLDVTPQWSATPTVIPTPPPPPTPKPAFDFGWNLSPTPAPGPPLHVGYDLSNTPFPFNCQAPPAKVGDWQPLPVRAAGPAATPPAPTRMDVAYTPKGLPNVEFAFPKKCTPSNSAESSEPRPSLLSMVGDAEKAANQHIDKLAQLMLGSIVNPGDDVRPPKPDEVLDSNRVIMSAFCESRDKLTRIFKDLIHLHHMAAVQARVVPLVDSLSKEVQKAEGKSAGSD
ncbi:uncharacterized protein F5891DRAFT_974226 [Suillus fuscotomentosus]|uniref:Uncharacterized protein n=1 Tax=Suillus fuscotomentosus TaxID=1912939 RepID=A0AAD4HV45_9AGAM|nr:uncharacterized protein F5891DRAFT_974226 [Suillus fuscotomentosus]KAG1908951.1 hypothetical protein F5891DRAFT_974226 [Suillus fuscotomentosus]